MANATQIDTDKLQKLMTCCEDGHLGYSQASEAVSDPRLRNEFLTQSHQRAEFRTQLNALSPNEDNDFDGSIQGKVHRGWINLKDGLNVSDEEICKDIITGEKQALDQYEEVLEDKDLDPRFRDIAEIQCRAIRSQYEKLEARTD